MKRDHPARTIVTCMLGTMVAIVCDRMILGLVFPAMLDSLRLTYAQAGQMGAANALGYLLAVAHAGGYAARRGERSAVVIGLTLSLLGQMGVAISSAASVMMVWMFVLGVGCAYIYTPLLVLLGSRFPDRRSSVIGMANSGIGIGLVASGWFVPLANQSANGGWRIIWCALAAISLVTLVAVRYVLPGQQATPAQQAGLRSWFRVAWGTPNLRRTAILYAAVGVAFVAHNLFVYSYVIQSGLAPRLAGGLVSAAGILSILAGPLLGQLSDRVGRSSILSIAALISALSTLAIAIQPSAAVFSGYFVIVGLITFGMPGLIIALASVQAGAAGIPPTVAASFVTVFYAVGQFLAPAAIGTMFGPADSLRLVFVGVATILCLALLPALASGRQKRRQQV